MQFRKNNHFVPQVYLKQWARNGKVPTYRLLVPHKSISMWKGYSLEGIAFREHLYTYAVAQQETDEFERWLAVEFDEPATEAIHRVVQEQRLAPEHWRDLVRFAFAQDLRTPASLKAFIVRQRKEMQELLTGTLEESVRTLEAAAASGTKLPVTPALNDHGLFPSKVSIQRSPEGGGQIKVETAVGRQMWLWSVRHLLTSTIKKIPSYKWTILHAPFGLSWPTSDNPLIRLNYMGPNDYNFGGGWGVENGDILLPLSPKHLLYTCVGQRVEPRGTVLSRERAQLLRKIIIEHADQYVFSLDESDVHQLRPRTVSLEEFGREGDFWRSWRREQFEAECDLQRP